MPKAVNKKRNQTELDTIFYERYDENFLFNKVLALSFVCGNDEAVTQKFTDLLSNFNLGRETDYDWKLSIRAEIYFTVFMQFEALFALLIAKFQNQPHWLYLTNYTPKEIKNRIQNFLDDNILEVTDNQFCNKHDFIVHSVYSNLLSPKEEPNSENFFQNNIQNILYVLEELAKQYIQNIKEYNSYKHGLRVTRAKDVHFEIPGIPTFKFLETIGFIDIKKDKNGQDVSVEVVKTINPNKSFYEIFLMSKVLKAIKIFRIFELKDEIPTLDPNIYLFTKIDKSKLSSTSDFRAEFYI